ncbi:MAG: polysaccharide pyruvyl transferase family protein [Fastidiosipilaceae bacterium]
MKEKVLLVTKCGKNYGATLQAYALSQSIKKKPYSLSVLNYSSKNLSEQFRMFRQIRSLKDVLYNILLIPRYKQIKKANQRFIEFHNEHLNLTQAYINEDEIINNPPQADIYIVGSDQVWNPNIKFSPIYFLNFGPLDVHRYSYSASIGISTLPHEYISSVQKYLSNFCSISVREESAERLLNEMGIHSITTVDPTLLLSKEEWTDIANEPSENNYILVYSLYKSELLKSVAEKIKGMTHCKIVCVATSVRLQNFGDKIIWDAGPREFIGLIKNASYVVTSSYHGMLFSLIFGKPFFVIPPDSTSCRFNDFLSSINMQNRIIHSEEEVTEKTMIMEQENTLLKDKIKQSNDYLDNIV